MGERDLATNLKKAQRLKAALVFVDESGLLMAPLVRRSWAPRGQTPLLYQRTSFRQKVSVIAALSVSPQRRRVGLYFSLRPNANVTASWLKAFLRDLAAHLRYPLRIVWDRLPSHRARSLQAFLQRRPRLHTVLLPPYAPELNPVETLWPYLKQNPLANLPLPDASALAQTARQQVRCLQHRQQLLRSFVTSTPLFLRLR